MSRSPIIEALKATDAKMLRDAKYTIENGILEHAGLDEINGVMVVNAAIQFPGGGGACSLGGLTCGQFIPFNKTIRGSRFGLEALLWLMAVAGVGHSEDLCGQYVRVAFDETGKARYIGHIVKDIWLDFERLAKGIKDEEDAMK